MQQKNSGDRVPGRGGPFARPPEARARRRNPVPVPRLNDEVPGVEKSHALENLRQAGRKLAGEPVTEPFYGMVFQDSDVAKWLEAAAYALSQEDSPRSKRPSMRSSMFCAAPSAKTGT